MRSRLVLASIFAAMLALLAPLAAEAVECVGDRTYETAVADGCTSITGDLRIEGTSLTNVDGLVSLTSVGRSFLIDSNAALTNLDGLAALTDIGGYLRIDSNAALANIDGLATLTDVGGDLSIYNNDALININGLAALTSVGSYLVIYSNDALTNLDGLSALTGVDGGLSISNHAALTNLDGLSVLTSVGDNLNIHDNPSLTDVDGLAALTSVVGDLSIYSNDALTNINGLSALPSVGASLSIHDNAALTNLDGLSALTSVGYYLSIGKNDALTSIDGLSALTSVWRSLWIEDNTNLCQQSVEDLLSQITLGGSIQNVSGNNGSCGPVCGDGNVEAGEACDDGYCLGDRTYETAVADGCTSITGDLRIEGTSLTNVDGLVSLTSVGRSFLIDSNAALTNLDGLAALTDIGGYLRIDSNAALANIDGLATLTDVGGDLSIYNNDALININGLAALTSVGSYLVIYSNDALTNLDGLSALTGVDGGLSISNHAALTNLDGLSVLTSVGDNLNIHDNPSLTDVDGLAALTSVVGDLSIYSNDALTNINGLSALPSVGASLSIHDNAALTNLDGLSALTSVGYYLSIGKNDALTSIDGLSALTSVWRSLWIEDNTNLCQQSVEDLLSQITLGGSIQNVSGNNGSCGPVCGDGNVEAGEACDDGYCCSSTCEIEPADTVCGPATDICDIEEVCDGTSPTCPADQRLPDTDTDGTCDDYDECPNDSGYSVAGVCGCPSAPFSEGTTCRAASDECDIAETCDGTSTACPSDDGVPDWDSDGYCDVIDVCPGRSDPAQADTDADGIGDVCDLCNGGATTTRQIVKVTNFATYDDSSPAGAFLDRGGLLAAEEGDDNLTFKATLQFDSPVFPNPEDNGFALTLEDATGKILLDLQIPPGAYNAIGRSGWISSQKRLRFVTRTPVGGLVPKVILKSKPKDPSQVVVIVKGKKGNFADPDITLPLKATVSLDPTDAMTNLCAEAEFPGPKPLPYCRMSGNGVSVTCK